MLLRNQTQPLSSEVFELKNGYYASRVCAINVRNGLHFPVPTSPRLQPTDILYAPRGKSNPNNTLTFITHTTPEEQRDLR